MPIAYIDRVDTLEADEDRGILERLVRNVRVGGLVTADWRVLTEALTSVGLAAGSSPAGEPDLILIRRTPKLVPGTRSFVDVRCEYERFDTTPRWEGDVSVVQVSDRTDKDGNPVKLTYTYPDDYQHDPLLAGQEVSVVAEYSTTKVLVERTGEFMIQMSDPVSYGETLVNRVNDATWKGSPARTWKITGIQFTLFDNTASPPWYRARVRIVKDPDTWDPTVAFVDPNTNEHPPDILDDDGGDPPVLLHPDAIKTITRLEETNFTSLFGA